MEVLVRWPPVARISRDRPRRPICVANCHDYSGGLCGCPADFPAVSAEGFSQVDIIDAAGVLEHLPMSECIGMMAKAMIALQRGSFNTARSHNHAARGWERLSRNHAWLLIEPSSLRCQGRQSSSGERQRRAANHSRRRDPVRSPHRPAAGRH